MHKYISSIHTLYFISIFHISQYKEVIHFQNISLHLGKINFFLIVVLSPREMSYIHSHNKRNFNSDVIQ